MMTDQSTPIQFIPFDLSIHIDTNRFVLTTQSTAFQISLTTHVNTTHVISIRLLLSNLVNYDYSPLSFLFMSTVHVHSFQATSTTRFESTRYCSVQFLPTRRCISIHFKSIRLLDACLFHSIRHRLLNSYPVITSHSTNRVKSGHLTTLAGLSRSFQFDYTNRGKSSLAFRLIRSVRYESVRYDDSGHDDSHRLTST